MGLGVFLLWAFFAPLDEGVPSEGTVSIDTKRKSVQNMQGGKIEKMYVKEGQLVKEGDLLLTLKSQHARAAYEESHQYYLGLRAAEVRLNAELKGSSKMNYHPDLINDSNHELVEQHIKNQNQLLNARLNSLKADLAAINESIKGQEAQIKGYQTVLDSRNYQVGLLKTQLVGVSALVTEGYAPRNQQSDLELRAAQTTGEIGDALSKIESGRLGIAELKQKYNARTEQEKKDINTQMADIRLRVDAYAEKSKSLIEELKETEVRSPATGQVLGLQIQTIGGVIQPGQKIMDIVPQDEPLLIEVKIAPYLIDKIRPGMDADIRFSNFSNSPQLMVDGVVDTISQDLLTDPQANTPPYYLARVSVKESGLKVLGSHQLQPGMPVQVVIKTGERSLMKYIMHPFVKRLAASMKEE
jgi:protease secretion system membrane fusion protein